MLDTPQRPLTPRHPDAPKTRAECPPMQADGTRPCPWVGCRHHLHLDVDFYGYLKLNNPLKGAWEHTHPCALDHADKGGMTQAEVGELLGITHAGVSEIELIALKKLRESGMFDAFKGLVIGDEFLYPEPP